jgi:hypothetical protein
MHTKERSGWKSITDAQKYLPASRSSYYGWIALGRLHSIRIGGSRYISIDSLEQLVRRAAAKKLPRRISEEMRQRGLASSAKRKEAKQQNGVG